MVSVTNPTCEFNKKSFDEFCSLHKIVFPKAFIDYLKEYNDAELEPNIVCFENNECTVRFFYGITDDEYSDISKVYDWYSSRLPHNCFPIADSDFGNQICISLEKDTYGKIYFWDHETMDTEEGEICELHYEDMVLLAESFEELLKKIKASPY